ncbi:MAG: hypothetical protein LIO65_03110 [Odoribacter sp.]|nr:hypothetical protein [Odoribacter sp.]
MRGILILILVCFLFGGKIVGQDIEYGVQLDTTYMLIGDQQKMTFLLRSDMPLNVQFPVFTDTIITGVEIISGPQRDSVKTKDGKWLLEESYVISAFDTGVYYIPSMPIVIQGENFNNVLRTEPIGFIVNSFEIDEEQGNYDIVMPYGAPLSLAELLPYILYTLLGLAIIGVGIFLWKRTRNKSVLEGEQRVYIPPYRKAIEELDKLVNEKVWQSGRVKEFYTRLTDIVREYLDGEFKIPAMEMTSAEIMKSIEKSKYISKEDKGNLDDMLQTADFVKFAKFEPLLDENTKYQKVAYNFLTHTNENVREEERRKAEELAAKKAAEKKAQEEVNKSAEE